VSGGAFQVLSFEWGGGGVKETRKKGDKMNSASPSNAKASGAKTAVAVWGKERGQMEAK